MRVVKVAETCLTGTENGWDLEESGYITDFPASDDDFFGSDADTLAEAAGRLCYLSFHRPNPRTASNVDYLDNIIRQRHFSVMEHASVTFFVEGVSRALLLELERHRFLSFSVVSQRYVDHSEAEFVMPPVLQQHLDEWFFCEGMENEEKLTNALDELLDKTANLYAGLVEFLQTRGYTRKEARGAARSVLPEGTETKFFVTGNLRCWRDVLEKRNSEHADQEIREFAQEVLRQLKEYAPNTFQDME